MSSTCMTFSINLVSSVIVHSKCIDRYWIPIVSSSGSISTKLAWILNVSHRYMFGRFGRRRMYRMSSMNRPLAKLVSEMQGTSTPTPFEMRWAVDSNNIAHFSWPFGHWFIQVFACDCGGVSHSVPEHVAQECKCESMNRINWSESIKFRRTHGIPSNVEIEKSATTTAAAQYPLITHSGWRPRQVSMTKTTLNNHQVRCEIVEH